MKKILALLILILSFTLCGCGATPEKVSLSIGESGWSYDDGSLFYAVEVVNDSESKVVQFPAYRVTAYNDADEVIATEDQTLFEVSPSQSLYFASTLYDVNEEPARVEFEPLEVEDYNIADECEYPDPALFSVVKEKRKRDDWKGEKFTGVINNTSDEDVSNVALTVLFRDESGKLVGGDTTFVDSVKAGAKTPFELNTYFNLQPENYEFFIQGWM